MKNSLENISCFKEKSLELSEKIDELKRKYSRFIDFRFENSVSDLLDDYFQYCFGSSMTGPGLDLSRNPYALLAIGDYAHERNCFFPEIKILFLYKEYIPDKASDLIKEILYPLWDIGFKASSYTRTIKDCFKLASKESSSFFSMYNSRLICGVSLVYSELQDLLRKKIVAYKKSDLLNRKYLNDKKRHKKYESRKYVLEPDPVNVPGGLKDLNSIYLMSKIKYGVQDFEDLKYKGVISFEEYENLCAAKSFIQDIVFKLKIEYEKSRIGLNIYKELSDKMRSDESSFDNTSKWFLRELTDKFNTVKDIYSSMILQMNPKDIKEIKKKNSLKDTEVHGLKIKGGMLDFNLVTDILKFPELLLLIFKESIKLKIFINPETKRIIKDFACLLNSGRDMRYLHFFEEILHITGREDNTLVEMIRLKLLDNLICGFSKTDTLFRIDGYHEIPVDLHIAETVYAVNSFDEKPEGENKEFIYNLKKEVNENEKASVLLWASLLHHFEDFENGDLSEILHSLFKDGKKAMEVKLVIELRDLFEKGLNNESRKEETGFAVSKDQLMMAFLLFTADIISRGSCDLDCDRLIKAKELYLKLMEEVR